MGKKKSKVPQTQICPIRSNVLVLPDPEVEKVGSIYVAQGSNEAKRHVGTVVACGEGHIANDGSTVPLVVAKGDRIIYDKYAGSLIEDEATGVKYVLFHEQAILAVMMPVEDED